LQNHLVDRFANGPPPMVRGNILMAFDCLGALYQWGGGVPNVTVLSKCRYVVRLSCLSQISAIFSLVSELGFLPHGALRSAWPRHHFECLFPHSGGCPLFSPRFSSFFSSLRLPSRPARLLERIEERLWQHLALEEGVSGCIRDLRHLLRQEYRQPAPPCLSCLSLHQASAIHQLLACT